MKAVEITRPGGPEVLRVVDRPLPEVGREDILIRVAASSVNRPDIAQRLGVYPPPPSVTDIPGLDVAGIVERAGPDVPHWSPGERVCALVAGGAYAEYCAVPHQQCMPIPAGLGFVEAASLPEVFFTAWNNVMDLGRLGQGESLLVQGGTSGVGVAAIQLARALRDATVFATAGTEDKRKLCETLGASRAFNYRTEDWAQEVRSMTGERGVDVVLDHQAGDYTPREMSLLAPGGRLVLITAHRGRFAEIDLLDVVLRRLTLTGSTLRARSPAFKGQIANNLVREVWPLLSAGRIRTVIQEIFPLEEVAQAQSILDANAQIGKVALVVDEGLVAADRSAHRESESALGFRG